MSHSDSAMDISMEAAKRWTQWMPWPIAQAPQLLTRLPSLGALLLSKTLALA